MPVALAFAAVVVVVASGLFLVLRRRRAARRLCVDGAWSEPDELSEQHLCAEVQRLAESTPELRRLFARLDCTPELEGDLERLLTQLEGIVRAEIPDFPAFQAALRSLPKKPGPDERTTGERLPEERSGKRNRALLEEVIEALDDEARVLGILNRHPLEEALPFVEQIPVHSEGRTTWRTPMELSILRKRPSDQGAFSRRLDELEALVRRSRLKRPEPARSVVLDAVGRVRRDLSRENAYLPTSLRRLRENVGHWLTGCQPESVRAGREQLESTILGALRTRHANATLAASRHEGQESEVEALQQTAREQASTYLAHGWMRTSWLTTTLLSNLLDTELASLPRALPGRSRAPRSLLALVCDEVGSGQFDADETIRRLRQLESAGIYVHSLNYALLRAGAASDPPPDVAGAERSKAIRPFEVRAVKGRRSAG